MSKYYPRIAKILKEQGHSQNGFAKKLGVPETTFFRWITGVNEPPFEMVEKTAELLNISIDEIIFERLNQNDEEYIFPDDIKTVSEARNFLMNFPTYIFKKSDDDILEFAKSLFFFCKSVK